ncbi:MAG: Bifunctional ligase/repressor BirA [Chlamydiia bacterium]|nr:Bifunctional ligase/repressor BirA [Chlamydiia bacterium]
MKRLHFKTIDSTHLYAKRSINRLKSFPLTVITADFQTGGIGRRLDRWISSEQSSLLLSFVYPLANKELMPHISKYCANALKKALSTLDLPITFKYPNDLMINGKKLSGIISETCEGMMITSVGLNLYQEQEELQAIDQPATSLFIETGKRLPSEKILRLLLHHFFLGIAPNLSKGL